MPRPAVGVVIGKGGDMIKKIQAETGARVQFQQAREEGPGDRRCYLAGTAKQVEQVLIFFFYQHFWLIFNLYLGPPKDRRIN